MSQKITVLGYYDRCNLGDEMFKHVLTNWLYDYSIEFINPDDCTNDNFADTKVVLVGGGDLINEYFLQSINNLIRNIRYKIPVYAISIGIPYPKMIKWGYLDIFDYIIYRNDIDTPALLDWYPQNRIHYSPDLGFGLVKMQCPIAKLVVPPNIKKIGVFLSRTILNNYDFTSYENMIDKIAQFLASIASIKDESQKICNKIMRRQLQPKYEIMLIPFCTSENINEDDRIINQNVFDKINKYGNYKNIKLSNEKLEISTIIPFFKQFHLNICTRFHSHIFSLIAGIPFLSLATTRKVKSLLFYHNLQDYLINIKTNSEWENPVSFDIKLAIKKFYNLEEHYDTVQSDIMNITNCNKKLAKECKKYIRNLLFYKFHWLSPDSPAFAFKIQKSIDNLQPFIDSNENIETKAEIISFVLTGNKHSNYNFGIIDQLKSNTFILEQAVPWILEREYSLPEYNFEKMVLLQNPVKQEYRQWNTMYFNQDEIKGYHRSGWNYIMKYLKMFNNPNSNKIFDPYLDKTFGWNRELYVKLGLLPFKTHWCGFFHHTPNEIYSINNIKTCIESREFNNSLRYCKGIYVLSTALADWLKTRISVPIHILIHPTELNVKKFCFKRFMKMEKQSVIQIGAWLRDTYAIYQLHGLKNMDKYALKGKNMDNYYISKSCNDNLIDNVYHCKNGNGIYNPHPICRPSEKYTNKYIVGLKKMIKNNYDKVQIIDRLSDEEYDDLLATTPVFIYLEDASAVNTIIECIVRATPILVNRLPAVEEYLGTGYPLFYDNFIQASEMLNDKEKLEEGHCYLRKMNLNRFNINTFLHNLINSKIYNS